MAISLVGAPVIGTMNDGGNVTLTLPTATAGDLVVLFGGHPDRATNPVGPTTTGYTAAYANDTAVVNFGVWYKFMGATPDTTVTGVGSAFAQHGTVYAAYVLRGVDPTTPLDTATVATVGTTNSPAITTVTNDAWVFAAAGYDEVTGGSAPTGYGSSVQAQAIDTVRFNLGAAVKVLATAGAEDPPAAWATSNTNSVAVTVAFRPAGAGGGAVTGTLSASVPRATASIGGSSTVPTFTGTLAATALLVAGALAGTTTVPTFTGDVAGSVPRVTGSLAGTTTTPTFTGSVSSSIPTLAGSIAGTTTVPGFTGDLGGTLPAVTGDLAGTVTQPAGSATLTATLPPVTGSVAGVVTAPTFAAALAATTPLLTGSLDGTVDEPPPALGTLDGTVPSLAAVVTGTVTGGVPYRDVTVLSITEHQRQVTVTEHARQVEVTEHQRAVTIEGEAMQLPREGREFYTLEIVTDPAVTAWEAHFGELDEADDEVWVAGTVDGANTRWLLAGPDAELDAAVAVIDGNVEPKIRAIDNPEIIVRTAPAVYLV